MIKTEAIKNLFEKAKESALRFPFVMACAFLSTVLAIVFFETGATFNKSKITFTLLLGLPLFLSLNLFLQSKKLFTLKNRIFSLVIGALILALYHWMSLGYYGGGYFIRYIHVSLILHLLVSFSAFINTDDDYSFWDFNKSLLINILSAVIYSSVFFIGLYIALLTVDTLFKVKIDQDVYLHLWFFSAILFQTWCFVAGIPKEVGVKKIKADYPKGLKIFVQYMLIPLVSLYMLILYVYMAKIVVLGEWPQGYIGWLVSTMSFVGVFNLLLIDPEKDQQKNSWIKTYSKLYYILILPLLVMLLIAIGKRIAQYGITEPRYFLIGLCFILFGISFYFIFSKRKDIKIIPVSLFIFLVIALFGPVGAYKISFNSQFKRVKALIEKNDLLKDSVEPKKVSDSDQNQLSSILDYLISRHSLDSLNTLFPLEATKELRESIKTKKNIFNFYYLNSRSLMDHMGLKYYSRWETSSTKHFSYVSAYERTPLQIEGYKKLISLKYNDNLEFEHEGKTYQVKSEEKSNTILIESDGVVIVKYVPENLVKKLNETDEKENDLRGEYIKNDLMFLKGEGDNKKFSLYVTAISGNTNDQGVIKLYGLGALLLVR